MSDIPRELKAVLLEDATTDEQRAFARLLAEECAIAETQKAHRCWTYIPSPTECERMRKYWGGDEKCPKCKKGRLILEFYHGNIAESVFISCGDRVWGRSECDFREYVSDDY